MNTDVHQDDETPPITVAIVDDHLMLAEALAATLNSFADISVVAIAGNCRDALTVVADHQPDVLLLDQRMPDGFGTDIIGRVLGSSPHTKVLLVTAETGDDVLTKAILAGASAVIGKGKPAAVVISSVRAAARDEALITPDSLRRLLPRLTRGHSPGIDITDRELEVLRLLALGRSTAAISTSLYVAPATTRNHIQSIMSKLGAHSRLEAVAIAHQRKILAD